MAGLLDGDGSWFYGDDTTKDQFGQTQADRRQPLWSGLIQGGMSLLAAGQGIPEAQRAQLLAQAGQAYGGIGDKMVANKSAAAQQILQGQQIKAGQAKLATADRLAALAKTPEFQTAVAKLEPEQRILLQAALDSGDMAHATSILSSAATERRTAAQIARQEKRDDAKIALEEKKLDAANPYGKSDLGVARYNLQHAHPGSYEYWAAYDLLSKDYKDPAGNVTPKTDLKAAGFPEPSGKPGSWVPHNTPVAPTAPTADATVAPPVVAPAVVPPAVVPPAVTPPVPAVVPPAGPAVPPPAPPVVTQPPPPAVTPPVPPPPVVAPGTAITPDVAAKIAQDPAFKVDETRVVNGVEFYKDKQGRVEYDTGTDRYRIDAPGKTPTQLPPLKQLDATRETSLIKNMTSVSKMNDALAELKNNPKALIGVAANLPDDVLQRADPGGQALRDLLQDIAGTVIHDRSGSAVSAQEMKRLGFLPLKTDTAKSIQDKLERMQRYIDRENRAAYLTNRREFKMPPDVKERYGTQATPAPSAAETTPKVKKYNEKTGEFE